MHSPNPKSIRMIATLLVLALLSPGVLAQSGSDDASLPEWDRLSPQQRELLIAPVRERWDARPERRASMLGHAQRWRQMTPEQRGQARDGVKRWRHMRPGQRAGMRALYSKMRTLDEAERKALRERWRAMTPEQRRAWVEANPAPQRRGER